MMDKIGALIKQRAIEKCPTDNGSLRQSIDYEIKGDTLYLVANSEGAHDMEYGRPPSPMNAAEEQDLTKWAERHKANPQRIVKYIKDKGIKVGTPENPLHITSYGRDSYRPFLRPAIYETLPEFKRIVPKEIAHGNK